MWLKVLLPLALVGPGLIESEPMHDGKPLSYWITSCFDSTEVKTRQQGEAAILKIGGAAVPALLEVLRDRGNPPVRTTDSRRALAANILGKLGPSAKAALSALQEAAKADSSFLVRASATDAVKMIETKKGH